MENPATWGEAEQVVDAAMRAWEAARMDGHIGLSQVRCITDALRRAGLLEEVMTA